MGGMGFIPERLLMMMRRRRISSLLHVHGFLFFSFMVFFWVLLVSLEYFPTTFEHFLLLAIFCESDSWHRATLLRGCAHSRHESYSSNRQPLISSLHFSVKAHNLKLTPFCCSYKQWTATGNRNTSCSSRICITGFTERCIMIVLWKACLQLYGSTWYAQADTWARCCEVHAINY